MSDTHQSKRQGGGYFTTPNRWIDAGYMSAAPGSVTQVYLHLCRWADNDSNQAAQPIRLIAKKCGLSEKTARHALRYLEQWKVITLCEKRTDKGYNVWLLNNLATKAPPPPLEESSTPEKSSTRNFSGGQKGTPLYQPEGDQPKEQEQPKTLPPDGGGQDAQQTDATPPAPETPPAKKPLPENGPIQQSVKRFCDVMGIENPVGYKTMLGQAKTLVQAGYTPDDVEAITTWLLTNPWWRERGIDLGTVVKQANKWKAAQNTAQRMPRRQADARGGLVFG